MRELCWAWYMQLCEAEAGRGRGRQGEERTGVSAIYCSFTCMPPFDKQISATKSFSLFVLSWWIENTLNNCPLCSEQKTTRSGSFLLLLSGYWLQLCYYYYVIKEKKTHMIPYEESHTILQDNFLLGFVILAEVLQ